MYHTKRDTKYTARVAANWLKSKRTTIFNHRARKVYDADGWHYAWSWAIVGCDGTWWNIDLDTFYAELGIKIEGDPTMRFFYEVLQSAGFRVHDKDSGGHEGAVAVIFD